MDNGFFYQGRKGKELSIPDFVKLSCEKKLQCYIRSFFLIIRGHGCKMFIASLCKLLWKCVVLHWHPMKIYYFGTSLHFYNRILKLIVRNCKVVPLTLVLTNSFSQIEVNLYISNFQKLSYLVSSWVRSWRLITVEKLLSIT